MAVANGESMNLRALSSRSPFVVVCAAALLTTVAASNAARTAPKPLKVFILAGQSNMEGQAVADLEGKDYNDGKGTLKRVLDIPSLVRFKRLRNDKGEWAVRDDV